MSEDGFQLRVRPVCEMPDAARPVGVEGGVVSPAGGRGGGGVEQDAIETLSGACWDAFPEASRATTA